LFTPAGVLGCVKFVGMRGAPAVGELTVRGVCGSETSRVEELLLLLLFDERDGEGDGVRAVGV
jgi:hypothetical protein